MINAVWRYIVRPIAVGGMMTGAAYTLFRMRKGLFDGLRRAVSDLGSAPAPEETSRTEQYMSSKVVFGLIAIMFGFMIALYIYLSHQVLGGIVAAIVMLIIAFFFAAVSGYLVGTIGSTNNPISGLTLTTLIIAALLMVSLGVSGPGGVAVVLGVAAVGCVSSAVAGELLQDFKVGWFLGGTPRRIQMAELIAVVVASAAMYWPLYILQAANIKERRNRIWRSQAFRAASRTDGHSSARNRGRRHAVAAGCRGRFVRRRDDHEPGEEPDAGCRGDVSSD